MIRKSQTLTKFALNNFIEQIVLINIMFINIILKVEVFVFVGLNWEDAPPEQFAVRGVDYKVIRLHII